MSEPQTWSPNGVPFCWQPKEALRRIEQGVETEVAASATMLYVTLTRIASDEESGSFVFPIGYIARLGCLSRSTIERRLEDLEKLELVAIEKRIDPVTKERLPSRYTLTSLSRKVASPRGHLTSATTPRRDVILEEQKKLSLKDGEENAHIPTESEFVGMFLSDGIPEAYLRSKWSWFEGNNAWLDRSGRLKNFRVLVRDWWTKDRAGWSKSKPQAAPASPHAKELQQLRHDLPLLGGKHRERAALRLAELEATHA